MTAIETTASDNNQTFFKMTYGLYVVSSRHEEKLNGYISNAVFQVTAEPAQFAICCSKDNFTAELINQSKVLSISVLKKDAAPGLIGLFGYKSGKDVDKFASAKYITGSTGAPILTEDSLAWFECRVTQTVDVGTHLLFTADIIDNALIDSEGEPLTYSYYRDVRKGKAPKNAPTYMKPESADETVSGKNKYKCLICGYIYDPSAGDEKSNVKPGTAFEDLNESWKCPVCGIGKNKFKEML